MSIVVAALYHFFDFQDFKLLRTPLLAELKRLEIKGSLLIAPEGVNGTLAGSRESMDAFLAYLEAEVIKAPFEHKESLCDHPPFARTKVRLKKETISMGVPTALANVGRYVEAKDWNALLEDPETVVIDTRNDYEVYLGTFAGAQNPKTRTFKELPDYVRSTLDPKKHKKIAAFCTGGIRCEKFTSWMVGQGFEEVYHLKGGILKYLEEIPAEQSKWQGECYVFDERVAVGHGLAPSGSATRCKPCGHTLTPEDRQNPKYVAMKSCPHCVERRQAA